MAVLGRLWNGLLYSALHHVYHNTSPFVRDILIEMRGSKLRAYWAYVGKDNLSWHFEEVCWSTSMNWTRVWKKHSLSTFNHGDSVRLHTSHVESMAGHLQLMCSAARQYRTGRNSGTSEHREVQTVNLGPFSRHLLVSFKSNCPPSKGWQQAGQMQT